MNLPEIDGSARISIRYKAKCGRKIKVDFDVTAFEFETFNGVKAIKDASGKVLEYRHNGQVYLTIEGFVGCYALRQFNTDLVHPAVKLQNKLIGAELYYSHN